MDDTDQEFIDAFDAREAERLMSGLEVIIKRHLGSPESERVKSLIDDTRRYLDMEMARKLAGHDDDFRQKRRGETDAQWKARVAQADLSRISRVGEIVTPEMMERLPVSEAMVMHSESFTLARTMRVASSTSLDRMLERGSLTNEQIDAAEQICAVVGMIERDVSMRGANLDARVDCSGSAKGALIERLAVIRLQVTYSRWCQRLPMPRRLVIDMLTCSGSMKAVARSYRIDWPKARKILRSALDTWLDERDRTWAQVDHEQVDEVYRQIGCGVSA